MAENPSKTSAQRTTAVAPEAEAQQPGDTHTQPGQGDAPQPAQSQQADNKVSVKLAHPIGDAEDITRLGLEPKDAGYNVGDSIRVRRDDARTLINAGYAQVDPENAEQVSKTLSGQQASQQQG